MSRARLLVAGTVVGFVLVLIVGIACVLLSTRVDVREQALAIDKPEQVEQLRNRGLRVDGVVGGSRYGGSSRGPHMPGELVVIWFAPDSVQFRQEIWRERGALSAVIDYYFMDPVKNFERDFGEELVRSMELPPGLHADAARLFCGNVGRSKTPQLEDCQAWGFWARYGQYLIYLELTGVREGMEAMLGISKFADARLMERLGGG